MELSNYLQSLTDPTTFRIKTNSDYAENNITTPTKENSGLTKIFPQFKRQYTKGNFFKIKVKDHLSVYWLTIKRTLIPYDANNSKNAKQIRNCGSTNSCFFQPQECQQHLRATIQGLYLMVQLKFTEELKPIKTAN